jgi:hypothetical protein
MYMYVYTYLKCIYVYLNTYVTCIYGILDVYCEDGENGFTGNYFLLFVWLFFFTYALLAVVYVSHVEDRFFIPLVCNLSK